MHPSQPYQQHKEYTLSHHQLQTTPHRTRYMVWMDRSRGQQSHLHIQCMTMTKRQRTDQWHMLHTE